MAAPEFTKNGIVIQTLSEIITELEDGYKSIYGNDINVDQDSPDGQRIGIEAKNILDVQSYGLSLYNSFDPDLASGEALNRMLKFSGIFKPVPFQSSWELQITASEAATLPNGYQIKDQNDYIWQLEADTPIVAGTNNITFKSELYGPIPGSSGSSFEQVTVVLAVTDISASGNATLGVAELTDEEVRQLRNDTLANPSYSTTGSLYAKIALVNEVTDLAIYENITDTVDSRGVPAHGLWIIVENGDDDDIAKAIVLNKTGGTDLRGNVEVEIIENVKRPDGTDFNIANLARFDRPTSTNFYLRVTATRKDTNVALDTDLIAQKLAGQTFKIGENLIASEMYEVGYTAGDIFILTDLEISTDNATWIAGRITADPEEKFVLPVANVTVTEVP